MTGGMMSGPSIERSLGEVVQLLGRIAESLERIVERFVAPPAAPPRPWPPKGGKEAQRRARSRRTRRQEGVPRPRNPDDRR